MLDMHGTQTGMPAVDSLRRELCHGLVAYAVRMATYSATRTERHRARPTTASDPVRCVVHIDSSKPHAIGHPLQDSAGLARCGVSRAFARYARCPFILGGCGILWTRMQHLKQNDQMYGHSVQTILLGLDTPPRLLTIGVPGIFSQIRVTKML